jgi:hypothetical protein
MAVDGPHECPLDALETRRREPVHSLARLAALFALIRLLGDPKVPSMKAVQFAANLPCDEPVKLRIQPGRPEHVEAPPCPESREKAFLPQPTNQPDTDTHDLRCRCQALVV